MPGSFCSMLGADFSPSRLLPLSDCHPERSEGSAFRSPARHFDRREKSLFASLQFPISHFSFQFLVSLFRACHPIPVSPTHYSSPAPYCATASPRLSVFHLPPYHVYV